jgi:hypothetical protein
MAIAGRWKLGVALFFIVALSAATAERLPAQQLEDVVYLKDGSIIHGTIVEQRPGESILIRTRDGNQFRYTMAQIEKMTKEPVAGAAAPATGGAPQGRVIRRKDPAVAFLLSFLLTGLGQGYNGQWGKTAAMWGGVVVSYAVAAGGFDACWDDDECGQYIGGLVGIGAVVLWSWIDAPLSASAINLRMSQRTSLEIGPRIQVGMEQSSSGAGYRFAPTLPKPAVPPMSVSLVRLRF